MLREILPKIERKLAYTRKLYEEKEYLKSLKHGESCHICYPTKIVGKDYIVMENDVYIGPNSRIEAIDMYDTGTELQVFRPRIVFSNGVRIQGNCHLGAIEEIIIHSGVLMGNGVFITDHAHGENIKEELSVAPYNRKLFSRGKVVIEKNVWLCERVVILPGVTIGEGSIVAAGGGSYFEYSAIFCRRWGSS